MESFKKFSRLKLFEVLGEICKGQSTQFTVFVDQMGVPCVMSPKGHHSAFPTRVKGEHEEVKLSYGLTRCHYSSVL